MAVTDRQKQEGINRLAELTNVFELNPKLVKYLREGRLYYSYMVSGLFGCIDTIEYNAEYARICREFEEETGAYVYHAIESDTSLGKMLTLLFVSSEKSKEDWKVEKLSGNNVLAYVYNLTEDFGEYGSVLVTTDNGALLRKA